MPVTTFNIEEELATWPDEEINAAISSNNALGSWLKRLLPDFLENPPIVLVVISLFLGLIGFILLMIFLVKMFVKKRRKSSLHSSQKPSAKVSLILMIGLLLFTCLTLTTGGLGLFLKQRQLKIDRTASDIDRTLAALSQTEANMAQQRTLDAQTPEVQPTSTSTFTPESTHTILPTDTATLKATETPMQTLHATSASSGLTGAQLFMDHSIFDDFSSDALDWPVKDDGLTILKYKNEMYHMQLKEKQGFTYAYLRLIFTLRKSVLTFRDLKTPTKAPSGSFANYRMGIIIIMSNLIF